MSRVVVAFCLALTGGMAVAQSEAPPRWGGMGLMRADTDHDGTVTRAEYLAQVDARFARMDTNGNGRLDPDELPPGFGQPGFGQPGPGQRGPGQRGPGPWGGDGPRGDAPPPSSPNAAVQPPPPPSPARPMVGATRDQFRQLAMARFDRIDTNHDGRIDQNELPSRRGSRPGFGPAPDAGPDAGPGMGSDRRGPPMGE